MANELRYRPPGFKDYFLIMQVHPEADAGIIDAAYWHLARRYSQALVDDPSAKAKLDELNEAYHILGSAPLREAYERERAEVLGVRALPAVPRMAPAPQPLPVMQRQRPRPRRPAPGVAKQETRPRWRVRMPRPSLPRLGPSQPSSQASRKPPAADPDELHASTEKMRERLRNTAKDERSEPPHERRMPPTVTQRPATEEA